VKAAIGAQQCRRHVDVVAPRDGDQAGDALVAQNLLAPVVTKVRVRGDLES
jgi:hypothetical protein